jgi:hypothetical protein
MEVIVTDMDPVRRETLRRLEKALQDLPSKSRQPN